MKKILILLLTMLLSVGTTLSAADLGMEDIIAMLSSDAELQATDISAFVELLQDTDPADDGSGSEAGDVLYDQIIAAISDDSLGLDSTMIADTTAVVDAIKADTSGTTFTLADAIADAGKSFDDIKGGLTQAFIALASEELSNTTELSDAISSLNGVLSTLNKFGQANAQTSAANSLFGHQGYKTIAVSVGLVGSFASDKTTVVNRTDSEKKEEELVDQLKAEGLKAGVSLQAMSVNLGLNLGWLIDGLYIGAVYGSTDIKIDDTTGLGVKAFGVPIYENLDISESLKDLKINGNINTSVLGATVNYQLVKPKGSLLRWNGLSLGTGVIRSTQTVGMVADLGGLLSLITPDSNIEEGVLTANFEINSSTITVPLEISTGVRILSVLNLGLGVGADLNFGSSTSEFNISQGENPTTGYDILIGVLKEEMIAQGIGYPYDNSSDIELANLKVMFGVGVGFGPVTLDANLTSFISPDLEEIGVTVGANFVLRI